MGVRWKRHSAWVTRSKRWPALRQQALRRDGFACVQCGARGRNEVDHILPVRTHPGLAFVLDNLQTLCGSCHTVLVPALPVGYQLPPDVPSPFADPHMKMSFEQTTYFEWRNSMYENEQQPFRNTAITCQGCHMASHKESEAKRQQQINEAQGEAEAILAVATATAEGLRAVAASLEVEGGESAMQLRIAEQYITQFGHLAKEGNTFVVPANLTDIASVLAMAKGIVKQNGRTTA